MKTKTLPTSILDEVLEGLNETPKRISSKFFYDETGDALFEKIMELPEYYLTRSEFEVLSQQKEKIFEKIGIQNLDEVIELGVGNAFKTKILLNYLLQKNCDFQFEAIDISENALSKHSSDLDASTPNLKYNTLQGDFFEVLENLKTKKQSTKLVLFLGSSIGNLGIKGSKQFIGELSNSLNNGDYALIGFDLAKDPKIILDAYNDKAGGTRAFNLNLIKRFNKELGANFNLVNFDHYPLYQPIEKAAKSYLVSLKDQEVTFSENRKVAFGRNEIISVEISQKYNLLDIQNFAQYANFEIVELFYDCKHYYVNTLFKKI